MRRERRGWRGRFFQKLNVIFLLMMCQMNRMRGGRLPLGMFIFVPNRIIDRLLVEKQLKTVKPNGKISLPATFQENISEYSDLRSSVGEDCNSPTISTDALFVHSVSTNETEATTAEEKSAHRFPRLSSYLLRIDQSVTGRVQVVFCCVDVRGIANETFQFVPRRLLCHLISNERLIRSLKTRSSLKRCSPCWKMSSVQ